MAEKLYNGELQESIVKRIRKTRGTIHREEHELKFLEKEGKKKDYYVYIPLVGYRTYFSKRRVTKAVYDQIKANEEYNKKKLQLLRAEQKALRSKRILKLRQQVHKHRIRPHGRILLTESEFLKFRKKM